MRKAIYSILLFVFLFSVSSCKNNDDDCISGDIPFTSLESEYGCINTPFSVDINLSEDYMIIQDQATFDDMVVGSCAITIDFTTYDLIIGKKTLTTGLQSIGYEVVNNCSTNAVDIMINIETNDATVAPNITYHVLIPKLTSSQSVNSIVSIL